MKSDFDTFPCIRFRNTIYMSNNFLLEHKLSNSNKTDSCNRCIVWLRNYMNRFHRRIYNHTFVFLYYTLYYNNFF